MEYEVTMYNDASIVGMLGGILIVWLLLVCAFYFQSCLYVESVCKGRNSGLESVDSFLQSLLSV